MYAARMLGCLIALAGLLLAGCPQKSTALTHVSGKVYYKGSILQSGVIVFSPDTSRGESGKVAIGTIKNDGTYKLLTDDGDGAAPGWYRVTVSVLAATASSVDSQPISLVPEKYRDPMQSLLQCEVKPNRDNHLDFNLD